MDKFHIKNMTVAAMIAALYFALGLAFAPVGFGAVQLRVAEALTLLCVFSPVAVWGVTLGCVLTNSYGIAAGMSILGPIDIVLGSAATLAAGMLSYRLRGVRIGRLPLAAMLPPVLLNALVIGGELSFAMVGSLWGGVHLLAGLQVGLGQLMACLLGLVMVRALERTGLSHRLFSTEPV
jgi:uncharacterized membrane protein